jgi:hypothetical protein
VSRGQAEHEASAGRPFFRRSTFEGGGEPIGGDKQHSRARGEKDEGSTQRVRNPQAMTMTMNESELERQNWDQRCEIEALGHSLGCGVQGKRGTGVTRADAARAVMSM